MLLNVVPTQQLSDERIPLQRINLRTVVRTRVIALAAERLSRAVVAAAAGRRIRAVAAVAALAAERLTRAAEVASPVAEEEVVAPAVVVEAGEAAIARAVTA